MIIIINIHRPKIAINQRHQFYEIPPNTCTAQNSISKDCLLMKFRVCKMLKLGIKLKSKC